MADANSAVFDDHAAMGHSTGMSHDHDAPAGSSMCSGMLCSGIAAGALMPAIFMSQIARNVPVSPDNAQFSGIDPALFRKPPKTI